MVSSTVPLRDYLPSVFQALNPFHRAKQLLAKEERSIPLLGDVIRKHELEKHFGVTLLHNHFQIGPDECVVRYFDDNAAFMSPRSTDGIETVLPYVWCLANPENTVGLYPLEFVKHEDDEISQAAKEELTLLEKCDQFRADFAAELRELGVADTFGLAALHSKRELVIGPGEALMEMSDSDDRVLCLKPIPEEEIAELESTQTLWEFWPISSRSSECVSHCTSHCHGHCASHGEAIGNGLSSSMGARPKDN